MKVENEIQLANIPKIFVKNLHEGLHEFMHYQLVFILVDDRNEI